MKSGIVPSKSKVPGGNEEGVRLLKGLKEGKFSQGEAGFHQGTMNELVLLGLIKECSNRGYVLTKEGKRAIRGGPKRYLRRKRLEGEVWWTDRVQEHQGREEYPVTFVLLTSLILLLTLGWVFFFEDWG